MLSDIEAVPIGAELEAHSWSSLGGLPLYGLPLHPSFLGDTHPSFLGDTPSSNSDSTRRVFCGGSLATEYRLEFPDRFLRVIKPIVSNSFNTLQKVGSLMRQVAMIDELPG
jgi:hypothetical protein